MFREEEQRPMSSGFAVRVAVISGFALVCFAVIFFRLWYVEVLSGKEYLQQAKDNRIREFTVQAPRGNILDANGNVLVQNRTALALQVRPDQLAKGTAARNDELKALSRRSGIGYKKIKKEIRTQTNLLPASPATLERDVNRDLVYFLRERQDQFPGITVEEIYVRNYPQGNLASQLFGYVAEINDEQLKQPQYQGLEPGDQIGVAGLELQYDSRLRGRNGAQRVQVDAQGRPAGKPLSEVQPKTGDNLVLTVDEKIQKAGEDGLAGFGQPGAFVAMNIDDGSILGMGSYPNFDPSLFTPPVSSSQYRNLNEDPLKPLQNRAFQSGYPTGSTFKPITALASLAAGTITPTETINDTGSFDLGEGDKPRQNAGGAAYGVIALQRALQVSSDVFFYTLGARDNLTSEPIQTFAKDLGLGSPTGIDLPYEAANLVPTPEWRNELYKAAGRPNSCGGTERLYGVDGCYETDRTWSIGDSVNLAIGQGDLQADPLQMAVAYAAIGNGGEVVRPHLAGSVTDPLGQPVEDFSPAPRREVDIPSADQAVVLAGLHDAAMQPSGTSYSVFGGFPRQIAGKTGTVETSSGVDQSWYVAVAPYPDPKVVVATTVEGGGFGVDTAAPITRDVLAAYFGIKAKQIKTVSDPNNAE